MIPRPRKVDASSFATAKSIVTIDTANKWSSGKKYSTTNKAKTDICQHEEIKQQLNFDEQASAGEQTLSESFVHGTQKLSPIKQRGDKTDLVNVKTVGAFALLTDRSNGRKVIE